MLCAATLALQQTQSFEIILGGSGRLRAAVLILLTI
jgi:hypothetical protein